LFYPLPLALKKPGNSNFSFDNLKISGSKVTEKPKKETIPKKFWWSFKMKNLRYLRETKKKAPADYADKR